MYHDSSYIDNLVDFGLGMAVARQVVDSFNKSWKPSKDVVDGKTKQEKEEIAYYAGLLGKPVGPLNEAEMIQLIQNRQVNKDSLVWIKGMPAWKPIQDVPEVLKLVALYPPRY